MLLVFIVPRAALFLACATGLVCWWATNDPWKGVLGLCAFPYLTDRWYWLRGLRVATFHARAGDGESK
jgi:hypothetical protein